MFGMYNVLDIAQYIIRRCNEQNQPISNLRLQKILYFVQAEFLVSKGEPCFNERIEAWAFGPVVPEVYHRYKGYGAASIPFVTTSPFIRLLCEEDQNLIDRVIDETSKYSVTTLVDITHNQTPWINAYRLGFNCPITNESIKSFFEED